MKPEESCLRGADTLLGVNADERILTSVYTTNGEMTDLAPESNGWGIQDRTMYDADGVTVINTEIYDAVGRLERENRYLDDRYLLYGYHEGADAEYRGFYTVGRGII